MIKKGDNKIIMLKRQDLEIISTFLFPGNGTSPPTLDEFLAFCCNQHFSKDKFIEFSCIKQDTATGLCYCLEIENRPYSVNNGVNNGFLYCLDVTNKQIVSVINCSAIDNSTIIDRFVQQEGIFQR